MDKLRLRYEQTGRAVWCSHLDTMRTLQRALNRADIPIKYSEGFNPHALLSILMPLSVGTESLCQLADIRVREEVDIITLPERLTAVLPEGFRVTDCYEDGMKPASVKWMSAEGRWEYDSAEAVAAAEACRELFAGEVQVLRRTKRGEGMFLLNEHIRELSFTPEDGAVRVRLLLSCNEPVVNPDLLTAAVAQYLPEWKPDGGRFCRIAFFTAEDTPYK